MEKEVWLTVTGEQRSADGHSDRNATRCRAFYEVTDGKHVFSYTERDAASGAVTESRMVFTESYCRIERSGAVEASMYFEPDRELESAYETGFGSIHMRIFTKRLAMRQVGKNFHARVSYNLHLQGGDPMECAVTIKAEPLRGTEGQD